MSAARSFLCEYFPGTDPISIGADRRDHLAIETFLVDHGSEVESYSVLSRPTSAGAFAPQQVARLDHVPYDAALIDAAPPASRAEGIFVTVEPVHTAGAVRVAFRQRDLTREAAVVACHAVLYDWDTGWLCASCRPVPAALFVEGRWSPTIPGIAALPEDLRRAYAAYRGTGDRENWWAISAFFDADRIEDRLALALCVVEGITDLDETWLGTFAAGPIEDLLGCELLDHIERDVARRAIWQRLIEGTYWHLEPPDVRERVQRFLAIRLVG